MDDKWTFREINYLTDLIVFKKETKKSIEEIEKTLRKYDNELPLEFIKEITDILNKIK